MVVSELSLGVYINLEMLKFVYVFGIKLYYDLCVPVHYYYRFEYGVWQLAFLLELNANRLSVNSKLIDIH